ncbi:hypothetical protein BDV25DRAFT_136635 [Aspergillus avenaceus]|uniref:DUF4267 domain-containing protein n=1 Tax=Aspergillus avenaceus TaxID=36643 RepID=A0A5N6U528_ASPAV|nr:hypothetical protein BDV25DRAFT_136635 [Aspergillus avenaceus]
MASLNSVPVYLVGSLCVALGLNCFARPAHEYERFGLPLESATPTRRRTTPDLGIVSPLIYLKGIREVTYGLTLIGLQFWGVATGVTVALAAFSLAGLGDAVVVWRYGGNQLRNKALGHGVTFVGMMGWAWWRATSA